MSAHPKKEEVFNGVSEADVPSARWGWSALTRRAVGISGVCGGLFLLLMTHGNHHGHVENVWLIGLAVLIFIGTAWVVFDPKAKQRTTVTARNKPVGHVEPDWALHQRQLTGPFADLSDEELLAMNRQRQPMSQPEQSREINELEVLEK